MFKIVEVLPYFMHIRTSGKKSALIVRPSNFVPFKISACDTPLI